MKLNEAFDRIAIINLPERGDRRRQMAGELRKVGLDLASPGVQLFAAIRPPDAGIFPSRGARGAYLSHLEVLRQARADGVRRLLVLEDDLVFSDNLGEALRRLGPDIERGGWDLLYLGHLASGGEPGRERLEPNDEPQVCLHFYAIRAAWFDPLIAYLEACLERPPGHPEGGPMHVDGAFSMFRAQQPAFRTSLVFPSLGWQRPSRSDITDNRWYDRLPGLRQGAGLARRAKHWLRKRGMGRQPA